MALIGRIRKRVGLVIGFVGVSLILFILGDLVTSNTGIMNRNSDVIGEISGEKIHYHEFEKRVETMTENYKTNNKTETVDPNTLEMLRQEAWGQYVNEHTLIKEYENLGISCGPEELFDMCTRNPDPQIRQAFTDPKTQQFDPNNVVKFLKDLPNRDEKTQQQWRTFEDALKEGRIANKYKNLIKNGLFITTEEAKRNYEEAQRSASIAFVRLDYNTINDTAVKFDDSDLKNYYNENKYKFKQPESVRRVEYITFDVTPSAEDREAVNTWVNTKQNEFSQSTNDILFVNQNSDTQFDSSFHAKGTLPPVLDTVLFTTPIGTIVGPYEDGATIKFSKLVSEKMVSDSVKARHILIKIENGDTARAMAKIDSLKNAIKKGSKFDVLAMTFSQDPGSGMKGGDLGWFKPGMMVPAFNDACFDGKKGDMPVVTSQFGVHLIEIMDKGPASRQIQVATVERKLEPSQKTFDNFYNKANEFAANNITGDAFEASVIKQGLNKRLADNLRENDKTIAGLEQPRELVRWAFTAKKGDVSKVFTFNDKYVIAHLTDIREKGYLSLETLKNQITAEVIKQKKAEVLIDKFEKANATSIDAIAQKLNVTPSSADKVNFANSYIQGIGNEPFVVGTIFAMKANQISKPVKGDNGVTVVSVISFTEAPPAKEYSMNIKQLLDQRKSRSDYEVYNALQEKAGIEDNRGKFY